MRFWAKSRFLTGGTKVIKYAKNREDIFYHGFQVPLMLGYYKVWC